MGQNSWLAPGRQSPSHTRTGTNRASKAIQSTNTTPAPPRGCAVRLQEMVVGGGVCEDGANLKVKQTRRRQWDGRPTPRLLKSLSFGDVWSSSTERQSDVWCLHVFWAFGWRFVDAWRKPTRAWSSPKQYIHSIQLDVVRWSGSIHIDVKVSTMT